MLSKDILERWVARYGKALERRRWWIILATVAIALCLGTGGLFLERTADNRVFFGEQNPEFQAFRTLEATYSESNNVLIAVAAEDGDMFSRPRLELIRDLTETLWRAPHATRVDSITNFQYSRGTQEAISISDMFPAGAPLDDAELDRFRQLVVAEPALAGLLISPDGRVTGINVNFQLPSDSPAAVEEIVSFLRTVTDRIERERPDIEIHMTGNVMIMSAFAEAADLDLVMLIPIMCLIIAGILYVLLRSLVGVAVAMLLAVMSSVSALGFGGWNGVVLSTGSTPAPLILLTITLAYSVHILTKFLDDYRTGWSKQEAIANSIEFNLPPIALISVTTTVGFFSLNASDAPPFHDLGTIVGVGVIATFLFSFTFVPALLSILPIKRPAAEVRGTRAMKRLGRFVVIHRHALFWSMLVLIGLLAFGISRIQLNDDWVRYFDERFEFRQDTEAVLRDLTGIDVLEYSVPADGERGIFEPAYLETLDRFASWLRSQPEVANVIALTDVLKHVHKNMHEDDPQFYRLPESAEMAAQYLLLYEMSLPKGLDLADRVSVDRSATRVTVTARRNGSNLPSTELRALSDRITAWLAANGGPQMAVRGSGLSLMFAHMSERNIRTMLLGTAIALLVISGILVLALKNLRLGAASLIPNFVPPIMGFGIWGYAIGEIGVAVSVVAAMVFGIVVDDTIHFLTKYFKGRRELGKSPQEAIQYTFATVGKALTVTTIVLVCGFLVLATSGFKVNSVIGLLTAITLAFALAADFLFLPALLLMFDRRTKKTAAGYRPVRAARLPSLQRRMVRYFERVKDGHPVRGGTPCAESIELWSNDYLSLDGHRAIVEAQAEALRSMPHDLCQPANQQPQDGEHRQIERAMAEFLDTEDAVICQSGWCANAGLIQTIADQETPVYLDIYAHASLWEGAHLAGAPAKPFRHNSPESLENMIKRHGPGIVVVDSIYSANGNICPLRDVADIAERQGCTLIVDESHAVGSYGSRGEGLVPLLGLKDKVHYRTVSLSKAFVTRAGLVAGPARVMQFFRQQSRPALFSSTILGHEVARLKATLEVVQSEGWRRDTLHRHTEYLRFHLNNLGYDVEASGSQVIPLPAGEERNAIALRNALEACGIFGAVFCFPATPKNGSLIRLSVNCGLSREDLDRVVQACTEIRRQLAA